MANHLYIVNCQKPLDPDEIRKVVLSTCLKTFRCRFNIWGYDDPHREHCWWVRHDESDYLGVMFWITEEVPPYIASVARGQEEMEFTERVQMQAIEFRHQFQSRFMGWVSNVLEHDLAEHFKGMIISESASVMRLETPEENNMPTFKQYCKLDINPDVIKHVLEQERTLLLEDHGHELVKLFIDPLLEKHRDSERKV